jgi:vanillate O-demethylase monooxygenase subunit
MMEDRELQTLDERGEAILYRAMRQYWQPVMYSGELGDQPAPAVVLGEPLVVARLGGELCVFPDLCVHRGTALSLGRVEGDQLRCAYHGWTYGPDGACTSIPARFGLNIPPRARLRRYLAAEKSGFIWVCLDGEPRHPIPEFPQFDDPAFRPVPAPTYDWDCHFARRVENYCDFAHFAWVHDGILGDHTNPEVPEHEVWRQGPELRMKIAMREPSSNPRNQALAAGSEGVYTHKEYRMFIPNAIWLKHIMSPAEHYVLFMSVCPIGPKRTRTFTYLTRNYDFDSPDRKYVDYNTLIIEQDKPVVESQRPEELPVDLSAELHIKGVDRVSVEYRKWLIEIARANGWKGPRRDEED